MISCRWLGFSKLVSIAGRATWLKVFRGKRISKYPYFIRLSVPSFSNTAQKMSLRPSFFLKEEAKKQGLEEKTPVWLLRAFKDSVPRHEAFRRRRKEDLPVRKSQTRPAGHEANLLQFKQDSTVAWRLKKTPKKNNYMYGLSKI